MKTRLTENGQTFNRVGTELSWRLVYVTGSEKAILFEAVGNTDTKSNVEEFQTEQAGIDRIAILGLTRSTPPVKPQRILPPVK